MTDDQYAALMARLDYIDACNHELLRRLPGEGYWRPAQESTGAPLVVPPTLVQEGGIPLPLEPATVVYPADTTTPQPSVTAGRDDNLEWAKAHPEEARALALRMTARMVGADPES